MWHAHSVSLSCHLHRSSFQANGIFFLQSFFQFKKFNCPSFALLTNQWKRPQLMSNGNQRIGRLWLFIICCEVGGYSLFFCRFQRPSIVRSFPNMKREKDYYQRAAHQRRIHCRVALGRTCVSFFETIPESPMH